MPSFVDLEKRTWELRVTARSARELRDEGAFDIFKIAETQKTQLDFFQSLLQDPDKAIAISWILCLPQSRTANVSVDQFLDSIDGDVARRLQSALMEAIANFFPEGDREVALRVAKHLPKELDRMIAKRQETLGKVNLEEMMSREADKVMNGGNTSGGSVATLARTRKK